MTPIGETLRRERLRRKLDLEHISGELKISPKLLEAIEEERFDRLPGGVFGRSFVRQYARLLGLDEEEIAGEMQRVFDTSAAPPVPHEGSKPAKVDIPLPRVEKWESVSGGQRSLSAWVPALALVVLVMLVCSGIYAWWQRERHSAVARQETPTSADVRQAAKTASAPAQAPVVQPPATESVAGTPQTAAQTPASQPASQEGQPGAPAVQPQAAPPPPDSNATTPVPANPNAPVRVSVTAQEPVWIHMDVDGKPVITRTLQANESRTVGAENEVVLRVGNAGSVAITLNGRPIGPVGPKGQVRSIQFTSGGFKILPVSKPAAAPIDPEPL